MSITAPATRGFVGLVLLFGASGCGLLDSDLSSSQPPTGSTLGSLTSSATSAPAAPSVASTPPSSGGGQASEPPAATTVAAGSVVETAPQGTLQVYQEELVLTNRGLGARNFGAPPPRVLDYVSSLLGSPTEDTGWVEAAEHPDCAGSKIRIVNFGVLSLQFSNDSPIKSGANHFLGWSYGSVAEIGESPDGLRTNAGIGLGSPLSEVLSAYPGAVVSEGDPDTAFPDSFLVDNDIWGLLSGPTPDDVTTQLFSQYGCGD